MRNSATGGRGPAATSPGPLVAIVNPFKGSFTASEVAACCRTAAAAEGVTAVTLPGSDGGDGLLEALRCARVLRRETEHIVPGPLGDPVGVSVGWLSPHEAIIESRLAVGLTLVPEAERDPLRASTVGLGELVRQVADRGARRVFVGLGGSATMDGGVGMARAWGWVPRDERGEVLAHGGGALWTLADLEPGSPPGVGLVGLTDVRNPLTGDDGARVYAAQKGAAASAEARLARGLERLRAVTTSLGGDALAVREGAGAAGGLGFGILLFARGTLVPGAAWVLRHLDFDEALRCASAVLTAEGAFDATSLRGKLTGEVLLRARAAGVPAALLAPSATSVPRGTVVETGGGVWDERELERRARHAIRSLFRLPAG